MEVEAIKNTECVYGLEVTHPLVSYIIAVPSSVDAMVPNYGVIKEAAQLANDGVGPTCFRSLDNLEDIDKVHMAVVQYIRAAKMTCNARLVRNHVGGAFLQAIHDLPVGTEIRWLYGADYWLARQFPHVSFSHIQVLVYGEPGSNYAIMLVSMQRRLLGPTCMVVPLVQTAEEYYTLLHTLHVMPTYFPLSPPLLN